MDASVDGWIRMDTIQDRVVISQCRTIGEGCWSGDDNEGYQWIATMSTTTTTTTLFDTQTHYAVKLA